MKISTLSKALNEVLKEERISFRRHTFNAVTEWLRSNFGEIRTKQAAKEAIKARIESGLLPA